MTADLLKAYEPDIENITLVPSAGGRFEVEVNGTLLFSKVKSGRHAQSGEVVKLIGDYLKDRKE